MASSPEAAVLTEGHRLAQNRLAVQTTVRMLRIWPLLDPMDVDGTFEAWLTAAEPVVAESRRVSTLLSANYMQAYRFREVGTLAGFAPVLAEAVQAEALRTSLLVTGPLRIKTTPGMNAIGLARAESSAAATRHALNGGRDTITDTVAADQRALGWARVTSGRPCSFCAMLASRGPVYEKDTGSFDAHDHCNCTAEPVYSATAEWPGDARRYQQLWDESTAGLSGDDARNAFRRALEAA